MCSNDFISTSDMNIKVFQALGKGSSKNGGYDLLLQPGGLGALKRWLAEPKMPSLWVWPPNVLVKKNERDLFTNFQFFPFSRCGNSIFCQEQMALLKEEIPHLNERFCKAMKMWNSLSNEKKADYQRKKKKKIQQYSEELQNWFSVFMNVSFLSHWTFEPWSC